MFNWIAHLAQLYREDNAVLFVGANLRHAAERQPIIQQVAEALAAHIRYSRPNRSLPAVARDYEVLQGRNALLVAVQEELARYADEATPIYRLLADAVLPTTKVITTRIDRGLEWALEQQQKPYQPIVRDTDVPFFDESKIMLIKILGDIGQPESLVLTEDDIDAFISKLPTVSDLIRVFFATKTLVFLGYELEQAQFKRFFRQVTRNLSLFRRTAYAVVEEPLDEVELRYWHEQGVEIHQLAAVTFLHELTQAIQAAGPAPTTSSDHQRPAEPAALPDQPYKGLASFTSDDAAIFAGRSEESQRLTNRILAHRLVVVEGESGSGKSSLLHAGVGPRLARQRAMLTLVAPAAQHSLVDLLQTALQTAATEAALPLTDDGLVVELRSWQQRLNGPVVLAIDQFEQFFLVYGDDERRQAMQQLANLVADRTLNLRLVIVIRDDFFARLQELEATIPGVLEARFHLERLGREAAMAAVVEPAALFGIRWEPALVRRLIDDLYVAASPGIAAPQLQIICAALYQATLEDSQSHGQITLSRYNGLGGAAAILGNYLAATVAGFDPAQEMTIHLLLGALVSTRGVKQRLSLAELTRTVQTPHAEVANLLDELTQRRLLQRYVAHDAHGDPSSIEYELIHDSLAPQIWRWLGDEFWKVQQVRELLRQAAQEWQTRSRLLPPDDLGLAYEQYGRLAYSAVELELLYAAAIVYDDQVDDWSLLLDEATRLQVLLRLLAHPEAAARGQAARRLPEFANAEVAAHLLQRSLTDEDGTVRKQAANSLARLVQKIPAHGRQVVDGLQMALLDGQKSNAAVTALITLRDQAPISHQFLLAPQRRVILHHVWALRLWRGWPFLQQVAWQGLQGGFAGMALGLGLYLASQPLPSNTVLSTLINVLFVAVATAGLIGGTVGWVSAASGALLVNLQDQTHRSLLWLVQTTTGSLVMSVAFALLGGAWLAGLVLGVVLVGVASAPWLTHKHLRLFTSGLTGMAVVTLCNWVGLLYVHTDVWFWLPWIGATAGIGFAFGLESFATLKLGAGPGDGQQWSWQPAWWASRG
jgi:hypothetical protein